MAEREGGWEGGREEGRESIHCCAAPPDSGQPSSEHRDDPSPERPSAIWQLYPHKTAAEIATHVHVSGEADGPQVLCM